MEAAECPSCGGAPREIEKKEMEHMKKRLISLLLAVSMVLGLMPVGAVADGTGTFAGTTITASDLGLDSDNKPTNAGGENYGWTYSGGTLTIHNDYSLDLGDATLDCTGINVVNNGTISGGVFVLPQLYDMVAATSTYAFINNGTISGGEFTRNIFGHVRGVLFNTSTGQITGGFFIDELYILPAVSGQTYTISGGVFLSTPSTLIQSFNGKYTGVAIRYTDSASSWLIRPYKLLEVCGKTPSIINQSSSSTLTNTIYLFGEGQTVSLLIPTSGSNHAIVDEWRYKNASGELVSADGASDYPVPVRWTQYSELYYTTSNRKVTLTSTSRSANTTVNLYPYTYKTALTINSDGLPDTTDIYQGIDGHYYNVNPSTIQGSASANAKWEYYTDANNKHILKLKYGTFDISNLSSSVQVQIESDARIRSDTEISSPVTIQGNGSIASDSTATFTGNVTLSGTSAKISGGVFKGTVTLDGASIDQINGGLFEKDINNSLYRVSLKDGKTFTVKGYTNNFPYVYVSPSIQLSVTSTDANATFGRINSTKLGANPSYCTVNGKTITFTVSDLIKADVVSADKKEIVLAPALEDINAGMFPVDTSKSSIPYGDTFIEPTAAKKADTAEGVGAPTIAGYYKLDDNGKVPANPTLLKASEVTDAGTYQVVLKVAETDTYAGAEKLTSDSESWRFTISPKTLDSADLTYTGLETTYNGGPQKVTVSAGESRPKVTFNVLYNNDSAAPTDAGTYTVTVTLADGSDPNYILAPNLETPTLTINKAKLTETDFVRDDDARTVKPGTGITLGEDEYTVEFNPAPSTQGLPTGADGTYNAGTYQAEVTVLGTAKNYYAEAPLTSEEWQFTVGKLDLTESNFDINVPTDLTYTGKAKEVTAEPKNGTPQIGDVTVLYEQADGTWNKNAPKDVGTHHFKLEVAASTNNDAQTIESDGFTITIKPHVFDFDADFKYIAPDDNDDLRENGKPRDLYLETTKPDIYTEGRDFVWKLYYRKDDDTDYTLMKEGEKPIKAGDYILAVWVKKSANFTDGVDESAFSDAFPDDFSKVDPAKVGTSYGIKIKEPVYKFTVEGGTARYREVNIGAYTTVEDGATESVPAKTIVYLIANTTSTDEPDVTLLDADEGSEPTCPWYVISSAKEVKLLWNKATGEWYFEMPYADIRLTTTEPVAPVSSDDGAAGTGVALVLGGAALGGAAYLVGTQLWLEANLPADASIPTRRQQLADLLWKQAGMPEPASTVLYPDVTAADSQKAARWCVEQGLMQAEGDTFQPAKHVFRPQVIKAWKQLQAGQKAG